MATPHSDRTVPPMAKTKQGTYPVRPAEGVGPVAHLDFASLLRTARRLRDGTGTGSPRPGRA
jgi:hypothetical protein